MFLDLSSVNANGTNRLAIITQCLFAVAGFNEKEFSRFPGQKALPGQKAPRTRRGQEDAPRTKNAPRTKGAEDQREKL